MCLPNALIRLIGCGGEVVDFLNPRSTSARVCLETALQAEQVQFFNNARAREELGWKLAGSIQDNIGEAVAWFRNETGDRTGPGRFDVGGIACSVRSFWLFGRCAGLVWWMLAWRLVGGGSEKGRPRPRIRRRGERLPSSSRFLLSARQG